MTKGYKIFLAIIRSFCMFFAGFSISRLCAGDYFLSSIFGVVAIVCFLIILIYLETIIYKLKDAYDLKRKD